jgi:hypothetical protein
MMRFDGKPLGELGEELDFGELLDAVRAAATPEEQESADEAISVLTTRLRSNRPTSHGTAVRRAATRGRRVGTRLGAAIVVTVFTASASLAISGQLPSGARDVAAAFLAQMGLFPVPRLEASGQLAASQTTEEPFGPTDGGRDARLLWMPPPHVDDGADPTRTVGAPPVIKPRPIEPPPEANPPPGVQPPPVIDPPPGVQPPPEIDPPHSVQPPPVIDAGDKPPPADEQGEDSPPAEDQAEDSQPADDQGEDTPAADDQGADSPPADDQGEDTPPADDQGEDSPPADDQGEDTPPADDQGEDSGQWPPSDKPGNGPPPFDTDKPGNGPPPFDTDKPGNGPPPFDTPGS